MSDTNPYDSHTPVDRIYDVLQKLIGLHRQLYETCKLEREALVNADVRGIQEQTHAKELVIETIKQQEALRIRATAELSAEWKKPIADLSLRTIILDLQAERPELSAKYQSALNALTILIERAKKLNESNRDLIERSLEHVNEMKKNVLGEAVPRSDTYTAMGQKTANTGGARLISKEA